MKQVTVLISVFMCMTGFVSGQSIALTEMSNDYGIVYNCGTTDFGMGISFYDFNNDGLDDLSIGGLAGEAPRFYQSTGDSCVQVTMTGLGLDTNLTKCLLWIDYDNDGDPDLSANNHGAYCKLFENQGTNSFADATISAGLSTDVIYSFTGTWGDFDKNSFLDFYIGNRDPSIQVNLMNKFYSNNGNGTFTDQTSAAMVEDQQGQAFQMVFTDYDKDGWPDIYIANDKPITSNTLFKNLGNGSFQDVGSTTNTDVFMSGMGIAPGDYNNNGFEDLYVTNVHNEPIGLQGNLFLHNDGNDSFHDVADTLGLRVYRIGWGASFSDFDNDGDLDLFVANMEWPNGLDTSNSNKIYENLGDGTFVDATPPAFDLINENSFGAAVGDINDDGYLDIAIMNQSPGNVRLWVNDGGSNNYVKITLEGTISNRDAVGSWVTVYYSGQSATKYTRTGTSYASQDGKAVHFGIGTSALVDSVVVNWPNGLTESFYNLAGNQTHHLIENSLVGSNEDAPVSNHITIYPNPSNGQLSIVGLPDNCSIHVTDIVGKSVFQTDYRSNTGQLQINLNHLNTGMFFVNISTADAPAIVKAIQVAND